ncbi:MAG: hypothetical protein IKS40_02390 [Treponema sp.]|nr:hypothetical protein [Treponema sp.]
MEYVSTGRAASDYTATINDLVTMARENPTWKREYMDAMMDTVRQQREMREAEEQGEHNARLEAARRMLQDKLSVELAAKYTGLSVEEVRQLQKNMIQ